MQQPQQQAATTVGFTTNSLIKGRWTVMRKIGQGAFGEIYSGKNIINNEMVAIKVEKIDTKKQVLKLEVAVLKKLQACPYVCRFITCGRHNDYNYMVMELLGDNLSELRRRQSDGKFSMTTTLKLGIQMIQSLEAVHNLGYLHRDVKPSKDLGRRDDLWSIFYVLVEFAEGQLPWRKLKDKDQIGEMKIKYNTTELVKHLPRQFEQFMHHLKTLTYEERPNYVYLQNLLTECYLEHGGNDATMFDWEAAAAAQTNVNVSNQGPQMHKVLLSPSTMEAEASRSRNDRQNRDSPIDNEMSPPPAKDSETASVIAASSDNEKSGSWNQKSSKKDQGVIHSPHHIKPHDDAKQLRPHQQGDPNNTSNYRLNHQQRPEDTKHAVLPTKKKTHCCTIM
ncbi:hypothetical protein SAMD00019534_087840 [Acytostelium subglobosum LB1]|uniref:hypothetical protein n=1 Tax=Acytostelium subglobosum LB1 TaxID=1410327 RepID=UPI000644DC14|nr:hypothetical protein SAMD00019534_087840 [Acytostelium subglobosum LB1]GAM25609.1 hypothetical protein SAMD00019534_087840 [Acytostelium subglobosum LB1]|eukprot:XP_012751595.1 hypothetical protein SAMD00019534_087840 [Acytostelium subglobosum LB1]